MRRMEIDVTAANVVETNVSDELYDVMVKRQSTFDGQLYVGIVSTGIVCFPSCKSRLPKRENVRVYTRLEDARAAGFRPCKRCKPDNPQRQSPDAEIANRVICIISERLQERLTLSILADELNISPYHLQRIFKRFTNRSPARQLVETRMAQARTWLLDVDLSIQEISQRVGFRSVSHFSAVFQKEVGVAPSVYRLQAQERLAEAVENGNKGGANYDDR